ncbi:MAG: hypothetical protein OXN93_11425 [bacterium]|nr:hypothetical protein [bacterium]
MRAWLGTMRPASLLVLDEAHHAAPSHGGQSEIESKLMRTVLDGTDLSCWLAWAWVTLGEAAV